MIRLPPRSPLFPYPPLFRSSLLRPVPLRTDRQPFFLQVSTCHFLGMLTEAEPMIWQRARERGRDFRRLVLHIPTTHADRKSTRLNSSHSQISYAVFCLKKKQ